MWCVILRVLNRSLSIIQINFKRAKKNMQQDLTVCLHKPSQTYSKKEKCSKHFKILTHMQSHTENLDKVY